MGMASSQARLLTLTSRLHSIEHKAQKLEAEKLRLANDSDKVYNTYLKALDATKIQYRALSPDGSINFVDATLAKLENGAVPGYTGEASKETFLLCNAAENKVFITPEFANAYDLSDGVSVTGVGTLDEFLRANNAADEPVIRQEVVRDYSKVNGATPVTNKEYTLADPNTYVGVGDITAPDKIPHDKYIVNATTNVNGLSFNETEPVPSSITYNWSESVINTNKDFQTINNVTYSLGANKNKTLQELFPELDFNEPDNKADYAYTTSWGTSGSGSVQLNKVTISIYDDLNTSAESNGRSYSYTYTAGTTLNDLFKWMGAQSDAISYDEATGKLTTTRDHVSLRITSSDDESRTSFESANGGSGYMSSGTNVIGAKLNSSEYKTVSYDSTQHFNPATTTIRDYTYSKETVNTDGSVNYCTVNGFDYNSTSPSAPNSNLETLTYKEYLDYLQSTGRASNGFHYEITPANDIFIHEDGNNHFSINGLTTTTEHDRDYSYTTDIYLNLDAIAENIYLAKGVANSQRKEDYNNGHTAGVDNYKTQLASLFNASSSEEHLRSLALLTKELNASLSSNDKTKMTNIVEQFENMLNSGNIPVPTSNEYKDELVNETNKENGSSGDTCYDHVTYNYNFHLDTQIVPPLTPSYDTLPDYKEIKCKSSDDDIKEYLALAMYNRDENIGYPVNKSYIDSLNLNSKQLQSLCSYKNDASTWNQIIDKLINKEDISAYTEKFDASDGYESRLNYDNVTDNFSVETVHHSHEEVDIPTLDGIASNLVVAFRKAGLIVDESAANQVLTNLQTKLGPDNETNNLKLGNINAVTCEYLTNDTNEADINNIYNYLFGSSTLNITETYTTANKFNRVDKGLATASYGTKIIEVPTGERDWVHDENYYELVAKYNTLKSFEGIEFQVITDTTLLNSPDYVRNWIVEGAAHLLRFQPSEQGGYELSDSNVSIENSLIEVSNEIGVKKAEAQYEADMNKINKKDRLYDTQLAKLEPERNAIKQEIDSLKTVAKENVDRTFKLFS